MQCASSQSRCITLAGEVSQPGPRCERTTGAAMYAGVQVGCQAAVKSVWHTICPMRKLPPAVGSCSKLPGALSTLPLIALGCSSGFRCISLRAVAEAGKTKKQRGGGWKRSKLPQRRWQLCQGKVKPGSSGSARCTHTLFINKIQARTLRLEASVVVREVQRASACLDAPAKRLNYGVQFHWRLRMNRWGGRRLGL